MSDGRRRHWTNSPPGFPVGFGVLLLWYSVSPVERQVSRLWDLLHLCPFVEPEDKF